MGDDLTKQGSGDCTVYSLSVWSSDMILGGIMAQSEAGHWACRLGSPGRSPIAGQVPP